MKYAGNDKFQLKVEYINTMVKLNDKMFGFNQWNLTRFPGKHVCACTVYQATYVENYNDDEALTTSNY